MDPSDLLGLRQGAVGHGSRSCCHGVVWSSFQDMQYMGPFHLLESGAGMEQAKLLPLTKTLF